MNTHKVSMKNIVNILFALVLLTFSVPALAQVDFVEGYYVDESGEKVVGLIKDFGKEETPKEIVFKKNVEGADQKIKVDDLIEFQIGGLNFKKFDIMIDMSPQTPPFLNSPKADYQSATVFLQTLLLGKASLYKFFEDQLVIYFLQIDNEQPEQLLKKYYQETIADYKVISKYRQQLWNQLRCDGITQESLENLRYKARDLTKVIKKYNNCTGTEVTEFTGEKKKWGYALSAKAGINNSSIHLVETLDVQYPEVSTATFGVELEAYLPLKKNSWSLFFNPFFHRYTEQESETAANPSLRMVATHSAIVLPIGVRYHMYLKKSELEIFLNAHFNQPIFFSRDVFPSRIFSLTGFSLHPGFGGGFTLKDRFTFEYRRGSIGNTPQVGELIHYNYPYRTITLGYTFLQKKNK